MSSRRIGAGLIAGLLWFFTIPTLGIASEEFRTVVYPIVDLIVPLEPKHPAKQLTPDPTQLIQLIESTVVPSSWKSAGGDGCLSYEPITCAFVVKQTPSVHRELNNLFTALRKAQDVEITVELRFVSVPLEMKEKLGIDGADSKTPGVVMLDDAQVKLLLQSVQADPRTNVLQTPKVTVFNGQRAHVDLTEQQVYVVGVDFETKDGRRVPKPITRKVKSGLEFALLPTVAPNAKNVTLHLIIQCGRGEPGEPNSSMPRFNTVKLEKILKMADGATALLTGWNSQTEVRHEVTSPILSKIPYVSRLFKNVSYGREMESTFVLVTPRIVRHQEREEAAQPRPQFVSADQVKTPLPTEEPEVTYVNKRSFELSYELDNVGPSNVKSIDVWVTRDGSKWEPYPDPVQPLARLPITVHGEGKYGFCLIPRNGAGLRGPTPKEGDVPQTWVVVDTTAPKFHRKMYLLDNNHVAAIEWNATDNVQLADQPVKVYWSEASTGPWHLLVEGESKARFEMTEDQSLPYQFFLRFTATDEAGNVVESVTSQLRKIDGKIPTIRKVRVKPNSVN